MDSIGAVLSRLTPVIDDLSRSGGNLGLSVGVLHQGQTVYKTHIGQRALSSPSAPNDETVYYVASLTKAVAAAATAILVNRGQLDWNTPVVNYLPEFGSREDEVGREATLTDFLSHRSGLAKASGLWAQRKQCFMMPKKETVRVVTHLKPAAPFRQECVYNNWGYGIVEAVIEKVTGSAFADVVQEEIFNPLELQRTTFAEPVGANVASANTNWNDGSICVLKPSPQSDKTALAAAGGLKSSLSDLLKLYQSLMTAYKVENGTRSGGVQSSTSPFRQVNNLFEAKTRLGTHDAANHGYALGWTRSVLPQRLSTTSMNSVYLGSEHTPIIGEQSPGTVVLHHHGGPVGAQASAYLIPETETAIVVLSNTLGFSDVSDWAALLILQTILGENPHDYIDWNHKVKHAHFKQYADLKNEIEAGKGATALSRDPHEYCGRYLNQAGNFALDISISGETGLRMMVQQFDDVLYEIFPYGQDEFYWPCDREKEMCEEMMYPWTWKGVHIVKFNVGSDSCVESLSWQYDPSVEAEVFARGPQSV